MNDRGRPVWGFSSGAASQSAMPASCCVAASTTSSNGSGRGCHAAASWPLTKAWAGWPMQMTASPSGRRSIGVNLTGLGHKPAGVRGRQTAAVALGAVAVLVAGYALVHVVAELASGHSGAAARWATMTFFAGVPLILAYAVARARFALPRVEVLLVVVVGVVLQGVLASGSFFTGDDWI